MAGSLAEFGSPLMTWPALSSTWTRGTSEPTGIGIGSGSTWSAARDAIVVAVCVTECWVAAVSDRWYTVIAIVPPTAKSTAASPTPATVSRSRRLERHIRRGC
jgi:hypothetical protein